MESLLAWGVLLIGAAIVLMIVDVFLPTGGILVVAAGLTAIAGVICLFRHDSTAGLIGVLVLIVLAPAIMIFGLKIWPDTPLGRRIIGTPTEEEQARQRQAQEAEDRRRQALLGAAGTVVIDLRPVGTVEIDGKRYDARSETFFIPAGTKVRVTALDANELRVRESA